MCEGHLLRHFFCQKSIRSLDIGSNEFVWNCQHLFVSHHARFCTRTFFPVEAKALWGDGRINQFHGSRLTGFFTKFFPRTIWR